MRAADRGRWAAALAAARRRWMAGEDPARITAELDALWAELGGDAAEAGPRHAALGALIAGFGSPGRGVTEGANVEVNPPRVSGA